MANLDFSYPPNKGIFPNSTNPTPFINMPLPLTQEMLANGIKISSFTIDMDIMYIQQLADEVVFLPENVVTLKYATEAEAEKALAENNGKTVKTTTAATSEKPEEEIEETQSAERIGTSVLVKTKRLIRRRFLPRDIYYIITIRAAGAKYRTVERRTTTAPRAVERSKKPFGAISRETVHLEAELRNAIQIPPGTSVEIEIAIQLADAIDPTLENPLLASISPADPLLEPGQREAEGVLFHFPNVI